MMLALGMLVAAILIYGPMLAVIYLTGWWGDLFG